MTDESPNGAGLRSILTKLGAFLAVAVAGALISHYTHVGQYLTTEKLEQVARHLGAWGPLVIVGLGIVTPIAMIPRWPLAFIGGLLYGVTGGALLATFASTLGAWLHYVLSRTLLAPMTERLKKRYRITRLHVPPHKEFVFILLIRAFPLSNFALTNLMAGALNMRMKPYVIASFLGMIPSSLMYSAWGKLMKKPSPAFYAVAVGLMIVFVVGALLAQRYVGPWLRGIRNKAGEDEE